MGDLADPVEPPRLDEPAAGEPSDKMRFAWRSEDKDVLARIEATAEGMFSDMFGAACDEMDRFYTFLRVPRIRNGVNVVDTHGRQVWETSPEGRPVEDWSQLTGQDIEQVLMNLQRIRMVLSAQVTKLKTEAMYAKMAADDVHDDVWASVMQGTQGDRNAKANRQSRQDRYHAYFRYALWMMADNFMQEITTFQKRLTDIRYWRIQDQR